MVPHRKFCPWPQIPLPGGDSWKPPATNRAGLEGRGFQIVEPAPSFLFDDIVQGECYGEDRALPRSSWGTGACLTMNRCHRGYRPSMLPASMCGALIISVGLRRGSCSGERRMSR
jgi:hypothetical protein